MQMIVRRGCDECYGECVAAAAQGVARPSCRRRQGHFETTCRLLKDHVHQTTAAGISAPTMALHPAPVAAGGERVRLRAVPIA